jgi:hypothetical protein
MKVDAREILFIRQNAPVDRTGTQAGNLSNPDHKVRDEFTGLVHPTNLKHEVV